MTGLRNKHETTWRGVHVSACLRLCVCLHICAYACLCLRIYVCAYLCVCAPACVCTCVCVHICAYAWARVCWAADERSNGPCLHVLSAPSSFTSWPPLGSARQVWFEHRAVNEKADASTQVQGTGFRRQLE